MKKIITAFLFLMTCSFSFAQEDVEAMRANARKFMQNGDMDNALLILNKATEANPNNKGLKKELIFAYFYKKEYDKALELIQPLLESADVDAQTIQLAGNVFKAAEKPKDAEKYYKIGLKKFPNSGPLYSEYGELLLQLHNPKGAIGLWEKGMQVAPSYAGNYYNAALHYFNSPDDKIWAIIYGEIYANMESLSPRANTMKKVVLDAYKQKLFANSDLYKEAQHIKNPFAKAVVETFAKQAGITGMGLNPETLAMIRTRFILDWNVSFEKQFPFKLFEYHQQLMRDGLFDSYNQWMFGPVDNNAAFVNWVNTNEEAYEKFTKFHTSRIFKMPEGQVYSSK